MKKLETKCARVKLKPGCLEKAYAWAKELNNRSDEVYQTLKDEGVYIESVFLEKTTEGEFLIYFMKMESGQIAREVANKSQHSIDKFHQEIMKEITDKGEALEILIDFERLSELTFI